MRCYADNRPCTCELDTVAAEGCSRDLARGPFVVEDTIDPFRAGELGLDDDLVYLNGLSDESHRTYG